LFIPYIQFLDVFHSAALLFSIFESVYILYFPLVRSELEYVSVIWNCVTSTDANKLNAPSRNFQPLVLLFLSSCPLQLCLNFRAFESVHLIGVDVSARYTVSFSSLPFEKSCFSSSCSVYRHISLCPSIELFLC
jgi:hypothetical protein